MKERKQKPDLPELWAVTRCGQEEGLGVGGKGAGRSVGRTLDLPEERSRRIQGISLGQLPELAHLLCARVFASIALFKGRPAP